MGQKSKIQIFFSCEMVISTGLLSEERLWLTVKHTSPVIDDRVFKNVFFDRLTRAFCKEFNDT